MNSAIEEAYYEYIDKFLASQNLQKSKSVKFNSDEMTTLFSRKRSYSELLSIIDLIKNPKIKNIRKYFLRSNVKNTNWRYWDQGIKKLLAVYVLLSTEFVCEQL